VLDISKPKNKSVAAFVQNQSATYFTPATCIG
jgi:hypothetical protein